MLPHQEKSKNKKLTASLSFTTKDVTHKESQKLKMPHHELFSLTGGAADS